jgi:hypothetical protein
MKILIALEMDDNATDKQIGKAIIYASQHAKSCVHILGKPEKGESRDLLIAQDCAGVKEAHLQRVEPTDQQIHDVANILHSAYNMCPSSVLGQPARMRWMANYFLTYSGITERKGESTYTAGEMEHYANAFANARDRRRVT